MKTIPPHTTRSLTMSLLLLILGCGQFTKTSAANILFVVNSIIDPVTPSNGNDQEVVTRLQG